MTGDESLRLRQVRSTNAAAEEAYLQGRLQLSSYGPASAQRALDAFKRALASDPNYGPAHAGAAIAYIRLGDAGVVSMADARQSAVADIRSAMAAGEDGAEVHGALAATKFLYDWDWDGAEQEYRRSISLNPGAVDVRTPFAQLLAARGRFDEALKISEETIRLDPQSVQASLNHGTLLYYKRDFTAARKVADDAIAQEPGSPASYLLASRIAEAQGRHQDALTLVEQAVERSAGTAPNLRVMEIRARALAGDRATAATAAKALEDDAATGAIRLRNRDRGYLELALGRTDAALKSFAAALDERDPSLVWITIDPRVDSIRNDPRFQSIIGQLKIG